MSHDYKFHSTIKINHQTLSGTGTQQSAEHYIITILTMLLKRTTLPAQKQLQTTHNYSKQVTVFITLAVHEVLRHEVSATQ